MSETMVDRVAKALQMFDPGKGPHDYYEGMARAAIAAMREPTADMIRAVRDKDEELRTSRHHPVADDWRAMIDSALAPAFKGTSNG
jgi:hypothetical protein